MIKNLGADPVRATTTHVRNTRLAVVRLLEDQQLAADVRNVLALAQHAVGLGELAYDVPRRVPFLVATSLSSLPTHSVGGKTQTTWIY